MKHLGKSSPRPPRDYRFRPAGPGDEPFLREMLFQAIYLPPGTPPLPRTILREPALARYVRDWGARPGDTGIVAALRATGEPAGAAWLRLFDASEPGFGFVADDVPELTISLLPEHRGRGVGTELMRRLVRAARRRFAAISLSVSDGNPAVRLYRRLGFREVAARRDAATMLLDLER